MSQLLIVINSCVEVDTPGSILPYLFRNRILLQRVENSDTRVCCLGVMLEKRRWKCWSLFFQMSSYAFKRLIKNTLSSHKTTK